jgi:REP-associated tyrosine transposase
MLWITSRLQPAFPGTARSFTAGKWASPREPKAIAARRAKWPGFSRLTQEQPGRLRPGMTAGNSTREIATRMANVFRQLYYHVVWSTSHRDPCLIDALLPHLYEAIEEKCRRLGCVVHGRQAVEDHVHVALEMPPSRAISFVLGQIKGASSHALNQIQPGAVRWQEGYGAVTFRRGELATVLQYIATQKERHQSGGLSPFLETCEGEDTDGGEASPAENDRP